MYGPEYGILSKAFLLAASAIGVGVIGINKNLTIASNLQFKFRTLLVIPRSGEVWKPIVQIHVDQHGEQNL